MRRMGNCFVIVSDLQILKFCFTMCFLSEKVDFRALGRERSNSMERNEGHGSCAVPGVEEEGKAKTKWQRALREQSVLEEWVGRQDITDKARTAQKGPSRVSG